MTNYPAVSIDSDSFERSFGIINFRGELRCGSGNLLAELCRNDMYSALPVSGK